MAAGLRSAVLCMLVSLSSTALANAPAATAAPAPQLTRAVPASQFRGDAPALKQCFVSAGQRYQIDPLLLYAIAEVESKLDPGATNRNKDGSVDYGLMQVNSQHLPRLKRLGINATSLLQNPCVSIHIGASILADMVARHGYTWMAVGAYNAGSGSGRGGARQRYAKKVWDRYTSLIATRSRSPQHLPAPIKEADKQRKRPPIQKSVSGFQWSADDHRLVSLPPTTSSSASIAF